MSHLQCSHQLSLNQNERSHSYHWNQEKYTVAHRLYDLRLNDVNDSDSSEYFVRRLRRASKPQLFFSRFLDKYLVGQKSSDSANYSEKWRAQFSRRPTWCDADMALQQIILGNATGNRIALYSRSFLQSLLFSLGSFVQKWSWTVFILGIMVYMTCTIGLQNVRIETDIVKLWVSEGGRLDEELHFLSRVKAQSERVARMKRHIMNKSLPGSPAIAPVNQGTLKSSSSNHVVEVSVDSGLGGRYQLVIQTPSILGENVLTKEALLKHVNIMNEISTYSVEMFGENWTLADICFKPPPPSLPPGPLNRMMSSLLDRLIPCIWITPIDCFWEGSKPLGPSPPINFGTEIQSFITSLPRGNVTWKNLDPGAVVREVSLLFDLGDIGNFFERAGIGAAYLDRWCIDPLDPECPDLAPNYYDRCSVLKKFQEWNMAKPMDEQVRLNAEPLPQSDFEKVANSVLQELFGRRRRKRKASASTKSNVTAPSTVADDYYAYDDDTDYSHSNANASKEEPVDTACLQYGRSLLDWMRKNKARWGEFLTAKEMPVYPDYGQLMSGGCTGFARATMKWPEDLIIGGIKRKNDRMQSAEAFQSVFLVSSEFDVYLRFKDPKPDVKPNLDIRTWSKAKARAVVDAWQRNFTQRIYDHPWNHEKPNVRQIHPLASTSMSDMLEEFSQFKFFVIFIGYILMFIYAGWSQLRWDGWWFAVESSVGLGIIGVLLVTYASISGLGLSTWMGIEFNAVTTQIVPFLTLGLGVDDMFLLLHNYDEVVHTTKKHEIGTLMKETGMSIVITSTNNIIAFMAGTLLPIPALRSFCSQSAILLSFNLVAIMVIYPSIISLDLRRRKAGNRDLGCCCCYLRDSEKRRLHLEAMQIATGKGMEADVAIGHPVYPQAPPPIQNVFQSSVGLSDADKNNWKWYTLRGFLHNYYIPLLQKPSAKGFILLICSSMFLFGCIGLYQSTLGLELSDVLPEDTPPSAFLRAREKYFSFYPMYAVLKGPNIDYAHEQSRIEQYRRDIADTRFVIKVDDHPSEEYWMSLMRRWLQYLDIKLKNAIENGFIDKTTGSITNEKKISDEARLARKLMCSYGNTFNCTGRVGRLRFVDEGGIINPDGFYNYLTGWFHSDNMMYYVSQAAFYPLPPAWVNSKESTLVPPAEPLAYSQIPFYLTDLIDTPLIVQMIREVRKVCDSYADTGLPNFPSGIAFTFWEQYLHLRWHLFVAICVIATAVFLVISFLVFNPWAAAMVMLVVVSMTIELAGFMAVFGVKLNPVSAVTLITTVGIGVEFTAHVVLAFLTSLGTKNERMAACMDHMFVPVIHGGLSTLLGIVMLAFSEFEFIVKYFFVVMSALILIGLINGLALLPVLLSLIGPSCEIRPLNGANYLPAPPPLHRSKEKLKKMSECGDRFKVSGAFVEMKVNDAEHNTTHTDQTTYHDSLSTIAEENEKELNFRQQINARVMSQIGGCLSSNELLENTIRSSNAAVQNGESEVTRSISPLLPSDGDRVGKILSCFSSKGIKF
ncbi:hypothetical protein AB6A40_003858 [Gnathostoma spinigerum]|uniref:SSD domain-containing protein n=1 Tax=Gnathostoma spinigerum TaxID=75299 RepID=A0ABD6EII3_9BILA